MYMACILDVSKSNSRTNPSANLWLPITHTLFPLHLKLKVQTLKLKKIP
jgi:hypothetical protein